MKYPNHFYQQCKNLKWVVTPKWRSDIPYSTKRPICTFFRVDVTHITRNDGLPLCCMSKSPYTTENCSAFEHHNNQTTLGDF